MPSSTARLHALGAWLRERDERRGYSVSYKRLALAYLAETVVITASLIGAWLFAHIYGHNDPNTMWMMMLAPIGYAVIEFCRVPLAVSARIQRSYVIKTLAVIGVVAAAGVTIKSMSQLGEIMFRPRLVDVVRANAALAEARDERASLEAKIAAADAIVAEQDEARKGAEKRAVDATAQLSGLPPQKCWAVSGRDRRGQAYRTTRCSTDPRTGTISQTLKEANADLGEVTAKLDAARAERAKYDRAGADRKVIAAEVAHKEAVLNSQLHSFTAMAFAKDPTEVTDGEIHAFLRVFVFVPAIFVSLASTLLALTAVEKLEPKFEPVVLADEAGQYILGPYAAEIIREATEAATQAADAAVEKARHPPLKAVV